jgi:hypothetical protein
MIADAQRPHSDYIRLWPLLLSQRRIGTSCGVGQFDQITTEAAISVLKQESHCQLQRMVFAGAFS